uniref:Uncharacterized protein n=1 Tax=Romanomermis culicivorax TaxID=13658 RepID=A0A915L8E3_ROMCU
METEVEAEVARVEITQPEILAEVAPVEGELVPNNVEAEQAETFRLEFEKIFKEARRMEKGVPLKLVRDTRIPQRYLEYGESAISEVVQGDPDMETHNCAVYSAALAIQHMVLAMEEGESPESTDPHQETWLAQKHNGSDQVWPRLDSEPLS